jgi:hypothetical protein|tara:strand:- start:484 stop:819 length:336 start_codon:yes stop_codon:yes gene_type:complete
MKIINKYKDHLWLLIFMMVSVGFVVAMVHILPEPTPPTEGIPHNYWMPNKNNIDTIVDYSFDTTEMQREWDSIDAYHRYWYEVLDTNSNGDIDDTEINKNTPDWTGTTQEK